MKARMIDPRTIIVLINWKRPRASALTQINIRIPHLILDETLAVNKANEGPQLSS